VRRQRGAALHGFFWTDAPGAEFAMVTSHGLELFSPPGGPARQQGLRPGAAHPVPSVQFFVWHHAAGLLLLACGPAGARLQASPAGPENAPPTPCPLVFHPLAQLPMTGA
jgi:hypothetical protein